MTPESTAAALVQYGIVKDPIAKLFLDNMAPKLKDAITNLIDELQFNPRPDGNQPTTVAGQPAIQLIVEHMTPKHILVYKVDEEKEKVFVMYINELRFSEPAQKASPPPQNIQSALLDLIDQHFAEEELKELCFRLNIEYDDLPASGKRSKAMELIKHCVRHSLLASLVQTCSSQRQDVAWPQVPE